MLRLRPVLMMAAFVAALAAATPAVAQASLPAKALAPIPGPTLALMVAKQTSAQAPILIRSYKKESELEVWKQAKDGRFVHLKTFPICRWSGQLGPKRQQGDRQAPEGFYAITAKQLNPNSAYHLSFDLGYPNAYDRAHGGNGSYLMVHGACTSAGCFAMTDAAVGEIYALMREAFAGGQAAVQFQSYPFRMSAENLAKHRTDTNIAFWRQLKEGADRFEATGLELRVGVAGKRYVFAPEADPALEARVVERRELEEAKMARLAEDGAAIRTTYADGGQHPVFAALLRRGANLGEVSRPEALAFAGKEITLIAARPKKACPGPGCPIQVADASGAVPLPASPPVLGGHAALDLRAPLEPQFSVFAFAPLTYDGRGPKDPAPALAGSLRILPDKLAPASFVVAAR
ncbi:MAG TPA: murein L,D-transpeptidase family protein [Beijerinckiaceae bacterium]|jgi:murein L,D-transpeptidase YafK